MLRVDVSEKRKSRGILLRHDNDRIRILAAVERKGALFEVRRTIIVTLSLAMLLAPPLLGWVRLDLWGGAHRLLGEQVDAFSCEHLLSDTSSLFVTLKAEGNLNSLLPSTNEYIWNTGAAEPLSAHHPKGNGGAVDKGKCDITFKVKRDTSIIFLKVIIPTIIVVYVGLLAVLLRAEDHSGDRARAPRRVAAHQHGQHRARQWDRQARVLGVVRHVQPLADHHYCDRGDRDPRRV